MTNKSKTDAMRQRYEMKGMLAELEQNANAEAEQHRAKTRGRRLLAAGAEVEPQTRNDAHLPWREMQPAKPRAAKPTAKKAEPKPQRARMNRAALRSK